VELLGILIISGASVAVVWKVLRTQPGSRRDTGGDDLVELTRVANRLEADVIAANLRSHGVHCVVLHADAWSQVPELVQGHRVMVRAEHVALAESVLEQSSPPNPTD
jgi:hypothetical protein